MVAILRQIFVKKLKVEYPLFIFSMYALLITFSMNSLLILIVC